MNVLSKSILVIDTPERCSMCEFLKRTDEGYCYCGRLGFDYQTNDYMKSTPIGKPEWCLLKEVPNKYPEKDYTPMETEQYMEGYEDGYNACINSIIRQ